MAHASIWWRWPSRNCRGRRVSKSGQPPAGSEGVPRDSGPGTCAARSRPAKGPVLQAERKGQSAPAIDVDGNSGSDRRARATGRCPLCVRAQPETAGLTWTQRDDSRPESNSPRARVCPGHGLFSLVVAGVGSNQRRLSRRFYIPEGVYLTGVVGGIVIGSALGGLAASLWGITAPFWFAFAGSAIILALIWRSLLHIAHADENLRADAPAAQTYNGHRRAPEQCPITGHHSSQRARAGRGQRAAAAPPLDRKITRLFDGAGASRRNWLAAYWRFASNAKMPEAPAEVLGHCCVAPSPNSVRA